MEFDFFNRFTLRSKKRSQTGLSEDPQLTLQARELVVSLGCSELALKVNVCWNARMRSTAGLANYAKSLILLNPKLVEFGAEEIDKTFRHELAHLVARARSGIRRIEPHGVEWKKACQDLGIADEKRCHTLPLPRRQVERKHLYQCPVCKVEFRRVRPFRRRVACLTCCRNQNGGRFDERFRLVKI